MIPSEHITWAYPARQRVDMIGYLEDVGNEQLPLHLRK
jgi:hypothetical protein